MAPRRLRNYTDAFQCGDYSMILRRAEWGSAIVLRSRKSRRKIDQAARSPLRGHLASVVVVCHSLSVALAGSSP
jgi:hypothetical protein